MALSSERPSTRSWVVGADGEERLGAKLDTFAGELLAVLHDRSIPGSRTNIDHLVVTPTGVWVVDAKRYRGRPELRSKGGIVRERTETLFVAGRDRTPLVDGVAKQVSLVSGVLGEGTPVFGVLCFIDADWPLIAPDFRIRDVDVVRPRRLYKLLRGSGEGPLPVQEVAKQLDGRFRPA